jgi:pimeloyl-ACP methyl ester carboxylesterase
MRFNRLSRIWTAQSAGCPEETNVPMLVLTGEKASKEFLIQQARLVADNVEGVVIKGSGHWVMDEGPHQVIRKLAAFFAN